MAACNRSKCTCERCLMFYKHSKVFSLHLIRAYCAIYFINSTVARAVHRGVREIAFSCLLAHLIFTFYWTASFTRSEMRFDRGWWAGENCFSWFPISPPQQLKNCTLNCAIWWCLKANLFAIFLQFIFSLKFNLSECTCRSSTTDFNKLLIVAWKSF